MSGRAGRRRAGCALATVLSPLVLALVLVLVPLGTDTARAATTTVSLTLTGTAQVVVGDPAPRDPALLGPYAAGPGHLSGRLARIDGVLVPLPPGSAVHAATGDRLRLRVAAPYGMTRSDVVASLADAPAELTATGPSSLHPLSQQQPSDPTAMTAVPPSAPAPAGEPRLLAVGVVSAASEVTERHTDVPTTGAHTITVLPLTWTKPSAPIGQLTDLAELSASFWQTQSGGRMTVSATVRPWVQVPSSAKLLACDHLALLDAALAANPGVVATKTDHVVVFFPYLKKCTWAGLGSLGEGSVLVNGSLLPDVMSHELGHNLGLGHANALQCVDPSSWQISLSDTCTPYEYYDTADVMGFAIPGTPVGNANAAEADYLGFLTSVDVDPDALTVPRTVDLAPMNDVSKVRAVRVALPEHLPGRPAGTTMYVEYRTPSGADTRRMDWAGVQVRLSIPGLEAPLGSPWTQLLALRPVTSSTVPVGTWTETGWRSPALPIGAAWSVPDTDLVLQVMSQSTSGARVRISRPAAPAAPVVVVNRPTSGWVRGAVSVTVRSDARYRTDVLVDGKRNQVLAAGDTGRLVPLGMLAEGSHTVTARSMSSSGTELASGSTTVRVDLTAPTQPAGLGVVPRVNVTGSAVSGLVVTWTASSDAQSGVTGYGVMVDGVGIGRTTGTTFTVPATRLRTVGGLHAVRVTATDLAGNERFAVKTVEVDAVPPSAPTLSVKVLDARHVRLTWTPSVDGQTGVAGYQVLRAGAAYGPAVPHVLDRTTYSATVTVPVGTTVLGVRATDRAGLSRTATTRVTTG